MALMVMAANDGSVDDVATSATTNAAASVTTRAKMRATTGLTMSLTADTPMMDMKVIERGGAAKTPAEQPIEEVVQSRQVKARAERRQRPVVVATLVGGKSDCMRKGRLWSVYASIA